MENFSSSVYSLQFSTTRCKLIHFLKVVCPAEPAEVAYFFLIVFFTIVPPFAEEGNTYIFKSIQFYHTIPSQASWQPILHATHQLLPIFRL